MNRRYTVGAALLSAVHASAAAQGIQIKVQNRKEGGHFVFVAKDQEEGFEKDLWEQSRIAVSKEEKGNLLVISDREEPIREGLQHFPCGHKKNEGNTRRVADGAEYCIECLRAVGRQAPADANPTKSETANEAVVQTPQKEESLEQMFRRIAIECIRKMCGGAIGLPFAPTDGNDAKKTVVHEGIEISLKRERKHGIRSGHFFVPKEWIYHLGYTMVKFYGDAAGDTYVTTHWYGAPLMRGRWTGGHVKDWTVVNGRKYEEVQALCQTKLTKGRVVIERSQVQLDQVVDAKANLKLFIKDCVDEMDSWPEQGPQEDAPTLDDPRVYTLKDKETKQPLLSATLGFEIENQKFLGRIGLCGVYQFLLGFDTVYVTNSRETEWRKYEIECFALGVRIHVGLYEEGVISWSIVNNKPFAVAI